MSCHNCRPSATLPSATVTERVWVCVAGGREWSVRGGRVHAISARLAAGPHTHHHTAVDLQPGAYSSLAVFSVSRCVFCVYRTPLGGLSVYSAQWQARGEKTADR